MHLTTASAIGGQGIGIGKGGEGMEYFSFFIQNSLDIGPLVNVLGLEVH